VTSPPSFFQRVGTEVPPSMPEPSPPPFFHCERGYGFRKLEQTDLPILSGLKAETWQDTHNATIANTEDQRDWFLRSQTDVNQPSSLFLSFVCGDDKVHGFYKIANINYINRSADVGWDLVPEARGHGLGTILVHEGAAFCFEMLNLRRLSAEILITNMMSQRCAQKAKFVVEGVKRQAVYARGEGFAENYVDSQMWGLLREDFNKSFAIAQTKIDRAKSGVRQ
jgi:RimJ/RimL family protein N-acetyltransferase